MIWGFPPGDDAWTGGHVFKSRSPRRPLPPIAILRLPRRRNGARTGARSGHLIPPRGMARRRTDASAYAPPKKDPASDRSRRQHPAVGQTTRHTRGPQMAEAEAMGSTFRSLRAPALPPCRLPSGCVRDRARSLLGWWRSRFSARSCRLEIASAPSWTAAARRPPTGLSPVRLLTGEPVPASDRRPARAKAPESAAGFCGRPSGRLSRGQYDGADRRGKRRLRRRRRISRRRSWRRKSVGTMAQTKVRLGQCRRPRADLTAPVRARPAPTATGERSVGRHRRFPGL